MADVMQALDEKASRKVQVMYPISGSVKWVGDYMLSSTVTQVKSKASHLQNVAFTSLSSYNLHLFPLLRLFFLCTDTINHLYLT